MNSELHLNSIRIDLGDLELTEIEVFLQEGSRGIPEFAASCSTICDWFCCAASCNVAFATQDQTPAK